MHLWGIHLSGDPRITVYEPAFLALALRSSSSSLAGTHPRRILHSIQSSVLLAYYFLRTARFLEGKFHISAAVSVALRAGLNRIRAARGFDSVGVRPVSDFFKDMREEGERIGAFWSVLHAHNRFASNFAYGSTAWTIDTPWPLDAADYVKRPHLLPQQCSGTVAKFLWDIPDEVTSTAALYAKAGVLYNYEEATRLGGRCRSGTLSPNDPEFTALDRKIDAFIPTLPPVQSQRMLAVHTLVHCATIQLHDPLATVSVSSRTRTLVAARAVADLLARTDIVKLGLPIDTVIAPLWTTTCLVFIAEIDRRRNAEGQNNTAVGDLKDCANSVVGVMEIIAPHCHLMALQLDAVRRAYEGVQGNVGRVGCGRLRLAIRPTADNLPS
ncbi:hypothetical protein DFH08DRAFT_385796, partial [Mycena albidolilacea]